MDDALATPDRSRYGVGIVHVAVGPFDRQA
jgi:hypothetical protein